MDAEEEADIYRVQVSFIVNLDIFSVVQLRCTEVIPLHGGNHPHRYTDYSLPTDCIVY